MAVVIAWFSVSAVAHAEDFVVASPRSPAPDPSVERAADRRWYGWETLIIDGAALTALTATGVAESNAYKPWDSYAAIVFPGLAAYVLGPPIVHTARNHLGKAGASFALRAGSLLLLTLAVVQDAKGDGCYSSSTDTCGSSHGWLWFGSLGVVVAVAVDAGVIAREDVRVEKEARWRWSPWLNAKNRSLGVSLGSEF